MNTRMNRKRLNIGTYILQPYARTEQHIRDLAASGIDFVVNMTYDRPALDLFEKYGVGAIVTGVLPGWWGGDGDNAGTLAQRNPMAAYEAAAADFADHPAIWGMDIGDEPSALDFPYYGEVYSRVEALFPRQYPNLNLYPNYASVAENTAEETVSQLGTATYEEYIRRYCECVPADYLCYDFYLYAVNVTKHYENLRIVARACRETGRSMWIVLQVNSVRPTEWMSENNLRFQAYTAMAFGAENIIWACYTEGWWHNQVLDEKGEKTEQYEKMKRVNGEIRTIAEEYMGFRNVSTHFVGFEGHPDMAEVEQSAVDSLDTGVFLGVHGRNGTPLVVGQMVSRGDDGGAALMVCAAGDPYDRNPVVDWVTFRVAGGKSVRAVGGNGKVTVVRGEDGMYAVPISQSEGVLLIAR